MAGGGVVSCVLGGSEEGNVGVSKHHKVATVSLVRL